MDNKKNFTFIDLFSGIGGFHIALESLGGKCVFASEIDSYARQTYEYNLKKISPELFSSGMFNDDIRKVSPHEIPDFDVLCAGFPCQPFSQAGYKKGFEDTSNSERGNLFFNIVEILENKRPKAFFLENVRGIINHDNGNTFKTIRNILENELGYSFHFKIVKASDYGLPQLRPRVFMIGFRDESVLSNFSFPQPIPLKFTMSDVWKGKCDRDIGYTLRVGGRGSKIGDRRNWDHYLVDGKPKQIMPEQAKKMQGFPDDFEFPVPKSQAMKQLGNSVAIDAVRACAETLLTHMFSISKDIDMHKTTKNKGEWTELYSFLKLVNDRKLYLADKNLISTLDYFNVTKVTTLNIDQSCYLLENDQVKVETKNTGETKICDVKTFLNNEVLNELSHSIKNGKGASFDIPNFELISNSLGVTLIKGGNSNQKSDVIVDIHNNLFSNKNVGFGIKSYLGNAPTLLNASGNTNFIYKVSGVSINEIDEINSINTRTKLLDRISEIYRRGGNLIFSDIERDTMKYNLHLIDSSMPEIVSKMLLLFYKDRLSHIDENVNKLFELEQFGTDLNGLKIKIKKLLVGILLGFFAGSRWDGNYSAKGTIVVKDDGEQLAYHISDLEALEEYLYNNIRFDTPSTTRHRYGSLIKEKDGIYFKLNLQLRF